MASVVETQTIPGNHYTSITRHIAATGAQIKSCLETAFAEAGLGERFKR